MVSATAAADTAIVLGAIGVFVASLTASLVQLAGVRKIRSVVEDTHEQVTTINSKTLAQLGDATETRRITELSPEDRTAEDDAHIREVPDAERPASIADRVESINRAVNAVPNGQPSLYELVQHLCSEFKGMAERLERLEHDISRLSK